MHLLSTQRLNVMEPLRMKKVDELMSFINKCCERGESVDIARASFVTALNIISNALFSTDFATHDSKSSHEYHSTVISLMNVTGKPNVGDYFPFLRFLDLQGTRKEATLCTERLFKVFQDFINARMAKRSTQTERKDVSSFDLLDTLLDLTQENKAELSLNDIKHFLQDLFTAGTDTNSTTVEWAMSELILNPEKMIKAQSEIQQVIGKNGVVQESDIPKLPYLQAIVKETLRLHPPAPLIPRKAESDVHIFGFLIPKDASVLVNVWAIGRDSRVWEDPLRFEPERFLLREIDVKGKDFELIPFGAGRRMCPGMSMALRSVSLVLASLLYSFDWKAQNGVVAENMDMTDAFGVTLRKAKPLRAVPSKRSVRSRRRKPLTAAATPPGPPRLPIIGNINLVGKNPHRSFANLSKTYGPVMSLKLGCLNTVVITSPEAAREVLRTHDEVLSNRGSNNSINSITHQERSLVWLPSSSPRWRLLRKLSATLLFSPKRLEATKDLRMKKVKDLISFMSESSEREEPVDISHAAFTTTLNIMSNILFSVDLGSFDPLKESNGFQDTVIGVMEAIGDPDAANYFPFMRFFDLQGNSKKMKDNMERLFRVFRGFIDAKIAEKALRNNPKDVTDGDGDFLDALLHLTEGDEAELNTNDIEHFLSDLFTAGTDTSSSTVEWAMAELLSNPKTMAKAQAEMDYVLGQNGIVQESDIPQLPYLQAVVKETFRLHPPAPLLVPRKAESDVEVLGYMIRKDTQVLVNVWAIGRDPSVWENPTQFEPERFSGKETDVKGRDYELTPFGGGRRICPGLPLAVKSVNLMLASLLYSFDWKLPNGINPEDLDMDETFGLTLHKTNPLHAIPIKKRPIN
ncbi:hypothetical protein Bca4012_081287 [Brassica carinata]